MGRFFVFATVVLGMGLTLYTTRPTRVDYLNELERRAEVMAAVQNPAFGLIRGSDPLDEMVAVAPPNAILEQTEYDDYIVFSVFTSEYNAPGYGRRSLRTVGVLSTFVSQKVR